MSRDPNCMCGLCGDPDNAPRPHNAASTGPRPTVIEDVFEFMRHNHEFTRKEIDAAIKKRWAIAHDGVVNAMNRLKARGLADWTYEKASKTYKVLLLAGEVVQ
ncbi:hypothetical protein [Rhodopirellula europaea]|uniref:hypothetical protein n=1 Tax=Rhodopirellula europaea TaxID=1263866 RepID=UPI003D2B77BA